MKNNELDEDRLLKTDNSSFVKDPTNNALLSSDKNKLNQYLLRRKQFERSKITENEINSMNDEINILKNDMGEVKSLLQTIIDKI